MSSYRVCCCFWRQFQSSEASEPPEGIKEVFARYSERGVMGAAELRRFMVEVQGETEATVERAQAIIDGEADEKHVMKKKKGLSLNSFYHYLLTADDNGPLPTSLGVYQDMGASLSNYFIYTGHNSYLTGNQFSSACSDVPIISALQRGVRVIELDLWPNAAKNDVQVVHGRTLTSPIDLTKCLRSIKEYAFVTSPYPVILTLEDHLTSDLQAQVAQVIVEIFGEMLYIPKSETLEEFPSPEDLKMRVIVSTKPPKEFLESKYVQNKDPEEINVAEDNEWCREISSLKIKDNQDFSKQEENQVEEEESEQEQDDENGGHILAPQYKRLITIPVRKRKGQYSDWLKVDPHAVTRLSLNEEAFKKATISHGNDVIRFTQKNLIRIFPKSSRINSSNYNPMLGWIYGAQMVALNMQGHGRALWLNHGFFRANGGCGYVKKPNILLNTNSNVIFDPNNTFPVKKTLKVRVFGGDGWRNDFHPSHFDTYSPPDFYIMIAISGVPLDTYTRRTKTIKDCWTPNWDEEFSFPLSVPELALLCIEVHEHDVTGKDDFGGQTCLPVWELRHGIRQVQLCDNKGDSLKSVKILMHFEFILQ